MNIVYPFCLTACNPLNLLGGGDPNGVATSQRFQRRSRLTGAVSAAFDPLGIARNV